MQKGKINTDSEEAASDNASDLGDATTDTDIPAEEPEV